MHCSHFKHSIPSPLETLRLQRRNGVHTMATAHASYVTRVKSGKNHVPSLGRVPRAGAPQALP